MTTQALLSAALASASKGKPVFPVGINKRPLTAHGFKDATTDPEKIRAMMTMPGVAGFAIPTGPVTGLVVIDRDRKNGVDGIAACAELEVELGPLPVTLQQRTGSGGDQLFYLYPDDAEISCSAGKIAPGVDIRGAGGYVVMPPSRNESGVYKWLTRIPPVPLPYVWIDRLARKSRPEHSMDCSTITARLSTAYGRAALETECRELAAMMPNTGRNARLNRVAFAFGQLVAGGELVETEALSALERAAAACGLGDHEAEKTIKSGFQAGLSEPRQARGRNV